MDKSGDKSMRGLLTGSSSYTYLARMKNDLRRAMNDPNITNEDLEKKIRNAELAIKGAKGYRHNSGHLTTDRRKLM